MSPDPDILNKLKSELPYLREHFAVKRVAVFGSASRGRLGAASDIDLVIELEKPLGIRFLALCDYIEEKLGRRADILTMNGLENIRVRSVAESIRKDLVYV